MKRLIVALSAFAIGTAAFAAPGEKDNTIFPQTTIDFEGRIIANACKLNTDLNGAPVQLGTYPAEYFTTTDIQTAPVTFNLKIEGCRLVQKLSGQTDEIEIETSSLTFSDQNGDAKTMAAYNTNHLLAPIAEGGEQSADNIGVLVKYAKPGENTPDFESNEAFAIKGASNLVSTADMRVLDDGVTIPMAAVMQKATDGDVTPGKVKARMKVVLQYK